MEWVSLGTNIPGENTRVSPCQDLGGGKGLLEFRSQCRGHCGQQSGRDGQAAWRVLAAEGHAGWKGGREQISQATPLSIGMALGHIESWSPWVRAASGQWGMQPGQVGEGAGCPGRRGTVGPSQGPGSQTVLCPAEVALSCPPFPWGLREGALGRGPPQLLRELLVPCPDEGTCPEPDCQCIQPEFHCGDPQCKSCKYYSCPPGQGVQPEGKWSVGVARAGQGR